MIELVIYEDGTEIKRLSGVAALWQVLDEDKGYIGGIAGSATYGELGLMTCAIGKHVYEDAVNEGRDGNER